MEPQHATTFTDPEERDKYGQVESMVKRPRARAGE
jgi:hypothetical protein